MGGVLVDLQGQRCIDAFEAIGAHEVAQYVRDCRTEDLFKDIEDGSISTEEFCDEARRISPLCKASNEEIIAAWNQLLDAPTTEKKEAILDLRRKGYRVFLLSNTNDMHWQLADKVLFPYKEKTTGDFFERVFLSYEMRLQKPSTEIYTQALREANLVAEETIFIDDNKQNVDAAASVGIMPFHECEGHRWTELLLQTITDASN